MVKMNNELSSNILPILQECVSHIQLESLQVVVRFNHPLVVQDVFDCKSLCWVNFQQTSDQVLSGFGWDANFEFDFAGLFSLDQIHRRATKWWKPCQQKAYPANNTQVVLVSEKGMDSSTVRLPLTNNGAEAPEVNGLVVCEFTVDFWCFEREPAVQITKMPRHWLVFANWLGVLQAFQANLAL